MRRLFAGLIIFFAIGARDTYADSVSSDNANLAVPIPNAEPLPRSNDPIPAGNGSLASPEETDAANPDYTILECSQENLCSVGDPSNPKSCRYKCEHGDAPTVSARSAPPTSSDSPTHVRQVSSTSRTSPSAKPPKIKPNSKVSSGDASTDEQTCRDAANDAIQCCNNPSSCVNAGLMPSSNSNGINGACNDTSAQNGYAAQNSSALINACSQRVNNCLDTCKSLGSANAGGSGSSLKQLADRCQGLTAQLQTFGSNASNNVNAYNQTKNNCNGGAGSMNPQSMGGLNGGDPNLNNAQAAAANNPNDPYGCQQNPGSDVCRNCALSPDSPSCKALQEGQQDSTGKASFQTASKSNDDFNVGDLNTNAQAAMAAASSQNMGQPPQGHTIPNGGAPFGGGGDSKPAGLDSPSRGGSPGAPGFNPTDIERGMLAGGFSNQPGGDLSTGGRGGGGYNSGRGAGAGRVPASAGMDLKKYLPGQRLDPMNRVGGNSRLSAEINPMSVDMFKKISARYELKCKLGVLQDCK